MKKKQMPLAVWIFVGLVVGIAAGLILIPLQFGELTGLAIAKNYIKPFGTIFLNLLKFVVVPIVLFSIASGVISITALMIIFLMLRNSLLSTRGIVGSLFS